MPSGQGRYGKFRWGEKERAERDSPPPRRTDGTTDSPTAREALGAGIALNPAHLPGYDWDFRIGPDGALLSTAGIDEYAKDIAFKSARRAFDTHGELITPEAVADLELDIERLLATDRRTRSVDAIAVSRGQSADTLKVAVELTVSDGQRHSVVIPVTR